MVWHGSICLREQPGLVISTLRRYTFLSVPGPLDVACYIFRTLIYLLSYLNNKLFLNACTAMQIWDQLWYPSEPLAHHSCPGWPNGLKWCTIVRGVLPLTFQIVHQAPFGSLSPLCTIMCHGCTIVLY